jgi:hypothetical protein
MATTQLCDAQTGEAAREKQWDRGKRRSRERRRRDIWGRRLSLQKEDQIDGAFPHLQAPASQEKSMRHIFL